MDDIEQAVERDMSVAPGNQGDAGQDESIADRLQRDPSSKEARLDRGLDESMDASDPPASTQPVHNQGPAPSSGYDEAEEKGRQQDA